MLVQRALGAGFREVTVEMATAGVASQVTGGGESVTASDEVENDEVGNDEVGNDEVEGDAVTVSGAVTGDEKWIGEVAGDERVSERASDGPVSATADAASAIVIASASASAVIVHRTEMMNCR